MQKGYTQMNTKQIPYLEEIARQGSLSAAARQLSLSQPALTKYLTNLEREMGESLFTRVSGRLVLTAAGEVCLSRMREIHLLELQTREQIAALETQRLTTLHLGISPFRGSQVLSAVFMTMLRRYPALRIIPHEGYARDLLQKLESREISLAITSMIPGMSSHLTNIPLREEEVVLAVPAFYRMVSHEPGVHANLPFVHLEQFREFGFIMPGETSALYSNIVPAFERAGFTPFTLFSTPNVSLEVSVIESGNGIGLIPAHYMKQTDRVAYYRLYHPPILQSAYLLRKGHILTEEERFFISVSYRHNPQSYLIGLPGKSERLTKILREFPEEDAVPMAKEEENGHQGI